jgi:hypothetical protein
LLENFNYVTFKCCTNLKNNQLENKNRQLSNDIEILNGKLKEIDRLKQLEDLVQSQRWGELGELAESMKNLSTIMASSTSVYKGAPHSFD